MLEEQSKTIRRVEYTAPAFWIDTVDLTFDLDPAKTRVLNKMRMRRNPDVAAQALRLDGEDLNLARVMVNGAGTVVLVSHSFALMKSICSRILHIHNGEVKFIGDPEEAIKSYYSMED